MPITANQFHSKGNIEICRGPVSVFSFSGYPTFHKPLLLEPTRSLSGQVSSRSKGSDDLEVSLIRIIYCDPRKPNIKIVLVCCKLANELPSAARRLTSLHHSHRLTGTRQLGNRLPENCLAHAPVSGCFHCPYPIVEYQRGVYFTSAPANHITQADASGDVMGPNHVPFKCHRDLYHPRDGRLDACAHGNSSSQEGAGYSTSYTYL